jgi:exodeoxyribonuclease V beta subunit
MAFLARFLDTGDFLTGYMDAVYQRDGRAYFLDWKTNTLPGYGPAHLAACVAEHFTVQAKIYTRVLLDFLGILDAAGYKRRFGGIHYVFLRDSPAAVHTFRPAWAEIQGWERDFRELHQMVAHV